MAKKWIAKATSGAHGQFRRKAEEAGKTTREFAAEKAGSPGKLGKEARLAETLMGMHHKKPEGHAAGGKVKTPTAPQDIPLLDQAMMPEAAGSGGGGTGSGGGGIGGGPAVEGNAAGELGGASGGGGGGAEFARGGRVRKVAGRPIGKDDGLIAAQKGEFVVRKAAVDKLGERAMETINRGRLPERRRHAAVLYDHPRSARHG